MKKMQSINDPLFNTLEPEQMRKVFGGLVGPTKTLPEVKITSNQGDDCGKTDADAPGSDNDGNDPAQ
jgi:hypothetical protein